MGWQGVGELEGWAVRWERASLEPSATLVWGRGRERRGRTRGPAERGPVRRETHPSASFVHPELGSCPSLLSPAIPILVPFPSYTPQHARHVVLRPPPRRQPHPQQQHTTRMASTTAAPAIATPAIAEFDRPVAADTEDETDDAEDMMGSRGVRRMAEQRGGGRGGRRVGASGSGWN